MGSDDAELMKLDADGNIQWVTQFGSSASDALTNVLIDPVFLWSPLALDRWAGTIQKSATSADYQQVDDLEIHAKDGIGQRRPLAP